MGRKVVEYLEKEVTENGEFRAKIRQISVQRSKEPTWVKLYVTQIMAAFGEMDMSRELSVFVSILEDVRFADNGSPYLGLSKEIKQMKADKMGISLKTFNNTITALIKKDWIRRMGANMYWVNPNYAAKGYWDDIKKIQFTWNINKDTKELEADIQVDYEVDNEDAMPF